MAGHEENLSTVCPYSSCNHFSSSLIIWCRFSRRSFTTAPFQMFHSDFLLHGIQVRLYCPSACLALGGSFPSASTKLRLTCAQQHRCNFRVACRTLSYTAKPSLCHPVLSCQQCVYSAAATALVIFKKKVWNRGR